MTPRKARSKLTAVKGWAVKQRGRLLAASVSGSELRALSYAQMVGEAEAVPVEIRELPKAKRK